MIGKEFIIKQNMELRATPTKHVIMIKIEVSFGNDTHRDYRLQKEDTKKVMNKRQRVF